MEITPVILCGGSGTRLWPVSRKAFPKQFAPLLGRESLFQATIRRLQGPQFTAPLVMTNADFRFLVTDQLAEIGLLDARILVEPVARNTAAAILVAALAQADDPDGLMLVAPSDHVIADPAAFAEAVAAGVPATRQGRIVTFGVAPDRPETGYGYLEMANAAGTGPRDLLRFIEKPGLKDAMQMAASGRHLWNAGIFLFRARDMIAACQAHAPWLMEPCERALSLGEPDLSFFRLDAEAWASARDQSVDYAVMEKLDTLSVVPLTGGWSDLGSWDALWRESAAGQSGVVTQGQALALDCEDTLLRSDEPTLQIVGLGLKGIAAIAMRDAVLVADMNRSQEVREVVTLLAKAGAVQAETYPRFHRPWGWYETLSAGARFQVKRIMVRPGGRMSLQSHVHRAEHWVVVEGTARVTVGDNVRLLAENESVYIPLGATHRLENPGKVAMFLIEVQTGTYLGEDDITRYEDAYARK